MTTLYVFKMFSIYVLQLYNRTRKKKFIPKNGLIDFNKLFWECRLTFTFHLDKVSSSSVVILYVFQLFFYIRMTAMYKILFVHELRFYTFIHQSPFLYFTFLLLLPETSFSTFFPLFLSIRSTFPHFPLLFSHQRAKLFHTFILGMRTK